MHPFLWLGLMTIVRYLGQNDRLPILGHMLFRMPHFPPEDLFIPLSFWRHNSWPTRMGFAKQCKTVRHEQLLVSVMDCRRTHICEHLGAVSMHWCVYKTLATVSSPTSLVNSFLFSKLIWKSKHIFFFFKTKMRCILYRLVYSFLRAEVQGDSRVNRWCPHCVC